MQQLPLNARLLLQRKSGKQPLIGQPCYASPEFEVVSIIDMQSVVQGFKLPTSWNSGHSLKLGWVPREVSTLIYMPIHGAVSSLVWTEKSILACKTRQTLGVPKHGNVFFYTEKMVRERRGREKRWGLVRGREVLFHRETWERLYNDTLWGREGCQDMVQNCPLVSQECDWDWKGGIK